MVVAQQPILLGALWVVLIAFSPLVLLFAGVRLYRLFDAIMDRRAVRRRATEPQLQPVERMVADLRRLRAELVDDPPTNHVRRTALLMAYDSVLVDLCTQLEIPTKLAGVEADPERELERLLAESAIQEAGISLHFRRRRTQP
ncbi:MAG TPA: hypothetical protein VGJ95_03550 [Pseudonocardiaceae bacterium]|jgi:hypothetical protein